jgi:hypothetical protein
MVHGWRWEAGLQSKWATCVAQELQGPSHLRVSCSATQKARQDQYCAAPCDRCPYNPRVSTLRTAHLVWNRRVYLRNGYQTCKCFPNCAKFRQVTLLTILKTMTFAAGKVPRFRWACVQRSTAHRNFSRLRPRASTFTREVDRASSATRFFLKCEPLASIEKHCFPSMLRLL